MGTFHFLYLYRQLEYQKQSINMLLVPILLPSGAGYKNRTIEAARQQAFTRPNAEPLKRIHTNTPNTATSS